LPKVNFVKKLIFPNVNTRLVLHKYESIKSVLFHNEIHIIKKVEHLKDVQSTILSRYLKGDIFSIIKGKIVSDIPLKSHDINEEWRKLVGLPILKVIYKRITERRKFRNQIKNIKSNIEKLIFCRKSSTQSVVFSTCLTELFENCKKTAKDTYMYLSEYYRVTSEGTLIISPRAYKILVNNSEVDIAKSIPNIELPSKK
jgi:hypothetical protein